MCGNRAHHRRVALNRPTQPSRSVVRVVVSVISVSLPHGGML
jgi:hypothetical protein